MKAFISSVICLVFLNTCYIPAAIPDSLYWRQNPPGDSAVIFAPGLISLANRRETKIVFSPSGLECLIGVGVSNAFKIMYSNHFNGYWSEPQTANFIANVNPIEPFFSPDSLNIFFVSNTDIYVSARLNQDWGTPVKLGFPVNTGYEEYHPTVSSAGTLYFCSTRSNGSLDIYCSKYENGSYSAVTKLDDVINRHNSQQNGAYDPFISADESYLIFTSVRSGGYGQEDQYISYKRNGRWTNPKNLGPFINSTGIEYGSYISPESNYYFFSRPAGWGPNQPADIYWVRADFILKLSRTNFVPYLRNQIPDQTDTAGKQFLYTFPDSTFADDDGNNTLTYSAALSSGDPLPSWLSFDSATRTFSGVISSLTSLNIKVTATDTASASASCTFTLNIIQQIGLNPANEIIPNQYRLLQNYPNPFNPTTSILFDIPKQSHVLLKVYDLTGREAAVLVNELLRAGSYSINLNAVNLSSGVYLYKLAAEDFTKTRKMILIK